MRKLYCIILILINNFSYSQKEGYNWTFNYKIGISFNNPNISPKVYIRKMDYFGRLGYATISTKSGRLLFYVNDGGCVFDSTHNTFKKYDHMLKGKGVQAAIFVPHPNPDSSNLYFVFSTNAYYSPFGNGGLYYSVIDLKLNNNLGAPVEGRINIELFKNASGKLTAVKHANRKGYWVLSHKYDTDSVFAYLVSYNGVEMYKPVKSNTGIKEYYNPSIQDQITLNTMKVSPDGKKLFSAYLDSSYIAEFNSVTGKVSNIIKLHWEYSNGGDFSSGSRFLYLKGSKLIQYDLKNFNKQKILASRVVINSDSNYKNTLQMQLGPDKKIYIPEGNGKYLHAITAPDSAGLKCNYKKNFLYLKGQETETASTPNMIQSFFYKKTFDLRQTCTRDTVFFAVSDTFYLDSAKWDFGDTASGSLNFSRQTSGLYHVYKKAGFYTAKLISFYKEFSDTIFETFYLNTSQPYLGKDTAMCKGGRLTIVSPPNYTSYLWNGSYKVKNLTINQAGTYRLTTVDYDGCVSSDTIVVKSAETKAMFIVSDTSLCLKSNSFVFKDKSVFNNDKYLKSSWNLGDNTFSTDSVISKYYANSGVFIVKLITQSKLGCIDSASREIRVLPQNKISFTVNDSIQCLNKNCFDFLNTSPDTTVITSIWDLGEQSLTKNTNSILGKTYSKDSTYTIKLFTQTLDGCKDTAKKQIVVLPAPKADFTWGIACSKTKTDFTFTGKKLTNSTFEWNFDNESKAYTEYASYMFSTAGNKAVKLVVKADNSCNDTIVKNVEIKKQALADFTVADICQSDSAVFVNKSVDADEFLWKFGDGLASGDTSPIHKYSITQTTTFLVTLVAKSGCADSVVNPVTVSQNPNSAFSYNQTGDKLNLKATSGYSSYKWKFNNNDSITVTAENYVHQLKNWQPIKVCLQITDVNTCNSQTCITVPLDIKQTFKQQTFKIYPNPNNGTFSIETQNSADLEVQIFDI
ncbi:MAG: hypothetical protein IT243_06185, partial [Bacteroidia bacterium]|nr:hypothetical protein [Bacteroidia bacterium]